MYIRRAATRVLYKSRQYLPKLHVDVDISAEQPNMVQMGVQTRREDVTMGMDV